MIKRFTVIILVCIMIASLTACNTDKSTTSSSNSTESSLESSALDENSESDGSEASLDEGNSSEAKQENTVIIESNGVVEDEAIGKCISLSITNNTNEEVEISQNYLTINNYMMGNAYFKAKVNPGDTDNELFEIPYQFEIIDLVSDIKDIDAQFKISNSSGYMLSDIIKVVDGGEEYSTVSVDESNLKRVANDNNVRVYMEYSGLSENKIPNIMMTVINDSDSSNIIQARYIKINGVEVAGSFYGYVAPHKIGKFPVIIVQGQYDTDAIKEPETVEFGISISSEDFTNQALIETEQISLK